MELPTPRAGLTAAPAHDARAARFVADRLSAAAFFAAGRFFAPVFREPRLARCPASMTFDVAFRTASARLRAVVEPVGDACGFWWPRILPTRSWTAVTPPCAMPLMLSPTRSTT